MTPTTIRAVTAGDAALAGRLVAALLGELAPGKPRDTDFQAVAARLLARPEQTTGFVAERDGAPLGILMLGIGQAIYAGGEMGTITELYVLPGERSTGVATRLLAAAIRFGRDRGWSRLEVGAPSQPRWERSLAFYRREGFTEIGPRLQYPL